MTRVAELVKSIGAHNLLATPSLDAFDHPVMQPLLERYMPSASGKDAIGRARIFRLAWDFVGSALGGRVDLYEHFYLASQPTNFIRDHMQTLAEGGFGVLEEFLAHSSNIEAGSE